MRPWLSKIRTHVFRGKTYRIFWKRPRPIKKGETLDGLVDVDDRKMTVHPNKNAWEFFWNLMHESQHTCFPDLDDHSVDQWEHDCKRIAKRCGFIITIQGPRKGDK